MGELAIAAGAYRVAIENGIGEAETMLREQAQTSPIPTICTTSSRLTPKGAPTATGCTREVYNRYEYKDIY